MKVPCSPCWAICMKWHFLMKCGPWTRIINILLIYISEPYDSYFTVILLCILLSEICLGFILVILCKIIAIKWNFLSYLWLYYSLANVLDISIWLLFTNCSINESWKCSPFRLWLKLEHVQYLTHSLPAI